MHAFTWPSSQLWLKVRDALLRSLHHSSLYRRLIVANIEKGARTNKKHLWKTNRKRYVQLTQQAPSPYKGNAKASQPAEPRHYCNE